MAYDEGVAALLRDELIGKGEVREQKMFGGVCFLVNGNMVCGVHAGGAMYRVGKDAEARALKVDGAMPLGFTGRKMGGMIEVADDAMGDDENRAAWTKLALEFVTSLPAK